MFLGGLGVTAVFLWFSSVNARPDAAVSGVVVNADGPVAGAVVRVRATNNVVTTAPDGAFSLSGLTTAITTPVTAWFSNYYITQTDVVPPASGITLTLSPYPTGDNPAYSWIYPHRADSPPEVDYGCDTCHADLIVAQWQSNAHSQAASSPRVLSLYNGTDITGTTTITPGYKLDFPGTAGNCAACHAPGAAANAPYATDLNNLTPPASNGVFCDFCHKTGDIYLNPGTGRPYPNMPGVLSHDLRRPPDGRQMFFGPFDDVPYPDTYLPLIEQGQFCAACHSFSFWGTPIYQSFDEWLDSPYPATGVQCQTCHMTPDLSVDHFVDPINGGYIRDPLTIPTHNQPGAADAAMLQQAVTMTVSARQMVNRLAVTVIITNTGAGHHVPTGSPLRQMILTVAATDGQGQALPQQSGGVVPEWGGAQAGQPGTVYAKLLRDAQSGESPVVNYWKPTLIVSDNRIAAGGTAVSTYTFSLPASSSAITIIAQLRFRRAPQSLLEARGWQTPDSLMAEGQIKLSAQPVWGLFLPLVTK